jgi:hypothetical protein
VFIWFKEASGFRSLVNIEQIVQVELRDEAECIVYLADGRKIDVDHSIDNIEKTLAEVTRLNTLMPR